MGSNAQTVKQSKVDRIDILKRLEEFTNGNINKEDAVNHNLNNMKSGNTKSKKNIKNINA